MNEEKKCEYCENHSKPLLCASQGWVELSVNIRGNDICFNDKFLGIKLDNKRINYCPMCGRKLSND